MFVGSTGIALSISCRDAWTDVTASITRREPVMVAIVRWKRESACRCAAGSARVGDRFVGPVKGPTRGLGQVAAGRELGRTGLDHAPELERVQPVQPPRRRTTRRTPGRAGSA